MQMRECLSVQRQKHARVSSKEGGPHARVPSKERKVQHAKTTAAPSHSHSLKLQHAKTTPVPDEYDHHYTSEGGWDEMYADDPVLDSLAVHEHDNDAADTFQKAMSVAQMIAMENATLKKMAANTKKMEAWVKKMDHRDQTHIEERIGLSRAYAKKADWIDNGIPWLHVHSSHPALERRLKEELLRRRFGYLVRLAKHQKLGSRVVDEQPAKVEETCMSPVSEGMVSPKGINSSGKRAGLPSWDEACEDDFSTAQQKVRELLKAKPIASGS
jgi:hypothetical protein